MRAFTSARRTKSPMPEAVLQVETVATDRPAVEAGLEVLRRGGDFADGVIAWHGMALGATVLATFDKAGIRVLEATADRRKRWLSGFAERRAGRLAPHSESQSVKKR